MSVSQIPAHYGVTLDAITEHRMKLKNAAHQTIRVMLVPTLMFGALYAARIIPWRLDFTYIPYDYWQLLPIEPLRDHPWRSLWFLHSQPPMLNLLLAAILKLEAWSGAKPWVWATLLMAATSWLACVVWHAVARRLLGSAWLAALVVALLVTNPGFYLFQSVFFYPQMEMLLTGLLAWYAIRFDEKPSLRRALFLLGIYALLVYTRALWNPAFAVAIALLIAWHLIRRSGSWRKAFSAALASLALFVALVAPWEIKNRVLFNVSGFTSWLGVNVRNLNLGPNALWEFIYTLHYDEQTVRAYYTPRQWARLQDEPAVTMLRKTNVGPNPTSAVNMNHLAVPAFNRIALRQTWEGYRRRPLELVQTWLSNLCFTSLPAAYAAYSYRPQDATYKYYFTSPYVQWHDWIYYGGWLIPRLSVQTAGGRLGCNLYLLLWLPLALAGGVLRLRRLGSPDGFAWALLFAMYVWMFAVIVLVDGSEGARMRWHLEPAFLILTIQALRDLRAATRRLGRVETALAATVATTK